mgnify:CR=1 FL=1
MQLKKIILKISAILVLTASYAYGGFEVEPLELHINLERAFAMLNITNKDQQQKFSLELRESESKKVTNDLSFSPLSFMLMPNKTQIVRVATKAGMDYAGKKYVLVIKTDYKGPVVANRKIAFKIPVFIDIDSGNNQKSIPANSSATTSPSAAGGLTQVKITVPVTATVE